jgi:hypothetical protein
MLRTVLLAFCCALALSASEAQQLGGPGTPPAGQSPQDSAVASPEDFSSPAVRARRLWRRDMAKKSAPKSGCFSTTFPSTEWNEAPCSTVQAPPHPARLDRNPQTAGNGSNPLASPSGPISSASGTLAKVSGVTSESDSASGSGVWSLQLNMNTFDGSPLCAGQANCHAWEQFIADNPGDVFIQYWLIGHDKNCPARPHGFPDDWTYFKGDAIEAAGCYLNGNQKQAAKQGIERLQGLRVTGSTSSAAQTVIYETADGQLFGGSDSGDPLSVGTNWNKAEFNIFGHDGGHQANLNPGASGASIVVQVGVDYGNVSAPPCLYTDTGPNQGYTAETNNLNPIAPCAGYSGQVGMSDPGIQFTEDQFPAIAECSFPDTTATCVPHTGSNFADAAFAVNCPAGGPPCSL